MIKIKEIENTTSFIQNQNQVGESNYLEDELLPAVISGDWSFLKDMYILYGEDGQPLVKFSSNLWDYSSVINEGSHKKINFESSSEHIGHAAFNIINQIKCFAISELYYQSKVKEFQSIASYINKLLLLLDVMVEEGLRGFEDFNDANLRVFASRYASIFSDDKVTSSLNLLIINEEFLPFNLNFKPITPKKLGLINKRKIQYTVIPPRIYFKLLNEYSSEINEIYRHKHLIEGEFEAALNIEQKRKDEIIKRIRSGDRRLSTYILHDAKFEAAYEAANISVCDDFSNSEWMDVYEKQNTTFKTTYLANDLDDFKTTIGGREFCSTMEFKRFLKELSTKCSYLLLALTGMRTDELFRISPIWGAQKVKIDGQNIFLISTRQSKITMNSQTKDDVFVTTETGYKAFQILNSIHSPLRKKIKGSNSRMFCHLVNTYTPTLAQKHSLGNEANKAKFIDFTLTTDDFSYLNNSDPSQTKLKQGDVFKVKNHQLRRSLAFYLIGYELLSFPQLKQQFSHFSMAMTRWYARNATSFKDMYSEIEDERISQQGDILARIYQKMADNKKIAGGKGKAAVAQISGKGSNYFEEADNNRKLSKLHWRNEIRSKKAHLHAIAPSMYCSNSNCDMRINIDLTECVDCEFDYIEDASYAVTSRTNAMRNILKLSELGDLNASIASKYIVQIRAAEKIMDDLDFEHEKFVIPEVAANLLIKTQQVN
jgi:hypothetical protein